MAIGLGLSDGPATETTRRPYRPSAHKKMIWAARLATLGAPILAGLYGTTLVLLAKHSSLSVPVGIFLGLSIFLVPLTIGIAVVAWLAPLVGAAMVLVIGILLIPNIVTSNYPAWYEAPYLLFTVLFVAGGVLYVVDAFLTHKGRSQSS